MKQLIIGLGSGRSGTRSLAKFLNDQQSSYVVHEVRVNSTLSYGPEYLLPWEVDEARLDAWLAELERAAGRARYYGDIASYFLPYVELIRKRVPNAKFVCLWRDKEEVVDSFMRKTLGVNHWFEHGGHKWLLDPTWDQVFPKFDEPDKRRAIEKYWDMYYERAAELEGLYPEHVRTFPIDQLNTFDGRQAILDFIGYPARDRRIEGTFRENRNWLFIRRAKRAAKLMFRRARGAYQ